MQASDKDGDPLWYDILGERLILFYNRHNVLSRTRKKHSRAGIKIFNSSTYKDKTRNAYIYLFIKIGLFIIIFFKHSI